MDFLYEKFSRSKKILPIALLNKGEYLKENHHHMEYELLYIRQGLCVINIDGFRKELVQGDFVFIEPNVDHYVISQSQDFKFIILVFDSTIFGKDDDPFKNYFNSICIKRFLSLPEESHALMNELEFLNNKDDVIFNFKLKSTLFQLISKIIELNLYIKTTSDASVNLSLKNLSIKSAITYIKNHFKENITLTDLLKTTNYSKSHFIRLFKIETGMNFTEYLNKYRIEKSCLDLIYSNKNITQIAMENGFNNIQYFSKTFKYYMQVTPKQYQKNGKDIIVPTSVASGI